MKRLLLLIILFFSHNLWAQWYWTNPYPQGNILNALTYSDNSLVLFGDYGTVQRTTNDGFTWIYENRVNDLPHNFTSIFKYSDNIIYAAGYRSQQNYSLLKSINNGSTWNTITYNNPQFNNVTNFCFVNHNTGFYVNISEIKKTTNGGLNWTLVFNNDFKDNINFIYFKNESTGFASGGNIFAYSDLMLMTTNAGSNWTAVIPSQIDNIKRIQFVNDNTGYAVSWNGFYKTTNGGFNWLFNDFPGQPILTDLHFINSDLGYIASGYYSYVYKTTNGGDNWIAMSTPNFWQKDIHFINEITGYVLGANNYLTKTTNAGFTWENLLPPLSTSSAMPNLHNTAFINSTTGVAVGWKTTVKKTTNGGIAWHDAAVHNVNRHLRDVVFLNMSTGYIIQDDSYEGNLLKSIDGGENWYLVDTIGSTNIRLKDIHFINSTTGFILDEIGNLYRSSDAGVSWDIIFNVPGNREFRNINFFLNYGFLIRANNLESSIYKTTNYGNNWSLVLTYPQSMTTVTLSNENTAYLLGRGILKTTNGGLNWFETYNGNIQDYLFTNVYFSSSTTGYAVGSSYGDMDPGVIFKTTNAGGNWHQLRIPTNLRINSVHFFNDNTGITTGNNATILRTTNGGGNFISNISNISLEIPSGYFLHQNFPNPFNPSTNIKFDIPKNSFVELKIFDISGREIAMLVSQDLNAGSYNYNWDAGNLPSGVYFYRISVKGSAGDFVSSRKMVMIK